MRLRFNEAKATQLAGALLSLRGGSMSYLKLIKLMYLVDREALLRWGRPVSTDSYVSMNKGPVLSATYDLMTDGPTPGTKSVWAEFISAPENYNVRLLKDPLTDELSRAEKQLIEDIFAQHGKKSRWEIVDWMHENLREWTNPEGTSLPIEMRDILVAGHKSQVEIAAIEDELRHLAVVEAAIK
jgi:uncharacterized phage-associated protein